MEIIGVDTTDAKRYYVVSSSSYQKCLLTSLNYQNFYMGIPHSLITWSCTNKPLMHVPTEQNLDRLHKGLTVLNMSKKPRKTIPYVNRREWLEVESWTPLN